MADTKKTKGKATGDKGLSKLNTPKSTIILIGRMLFTKDMHVARPVQAPEKPPPPSPARPISDREAPAANPHTQSGSRRTDRPFRGPSATARLRGSARHLREETPPSAGHDASESPTAAARRRRDKGRKCVTAAGSRRKAGSGCVPSGRPEVSSPPWPCVPVCRRSEMLGDRVPGGSVITANVAL
ncbi:uncharacterized protein LOC128931902 [Callithrix jacchus]